MDDTALLRLCPFLKDIVTSGIDVREILTNSIKKNIIYKALEEGQKIPTVEEIIAKEQAGWSDE